jgi:hypothetical protein
MVDNLESTYTSVPSGSKGNRTTTVGHNFIEDIVPSLHAEASPERFHCLHYPAGS